MNRASAFRRAVAIAALCTLSTSSAAEKYWGEDEPQNRACIARLKAGRFLVQQLKASKRCVPSTEVKGSTDCVFAAGKTAVRIVAATEGDAKMRAAGLLGSGFYVESADPSMNVRAYIHEDLGLVIRVDWRKFDDCIYDEAFITLNSRIKGAGPWGADIGD